MALETVRVYAVDENSNPLEGILVRAYDDTDTFVTQNATVLVGGEAYCELSLDGDDPPIEYTIRLSKTGVAFDGLLGDDSKTPQTISIYSPASLSPTGTNYFQVQGQTFTRPTATDPLFCRCSAHFVDISGRPLENLDIHIIHPNYNCEEIPFTPLILNDSGVFGDKVYLRTDEDGYVVVDLPRGGELFALVEGISHDRRKMVIPDTSSANLINLIFPVVESIVFSDNPLSLSIGDTFDVTLTIIASDGQILDPLENDVVFASNDENIVAIELLSTGLLRVSAVATGTAIVTGARADESIVRIPDTLTQTPLSISVS